MYPVSTHFDLTKIKNENNPKISPNNSKALYDYNSKNKNLTYQINNLARKPISLNKTFTPLKLSKLFYKALRKTLLDINV